MNKRILLCAALMAACATSSLAQLTIESIRISGNRVKESVIRKNLGFKEGDIWNDDLINTGKKNLFRLKIFKELSMAAKVSPSSSTVTVDIAAKDGWFLLPIPMTSVQGGEQRFILLLTSQNICRTAERMTLFNSFKEGGVSSLFIFSNKDYSLTFGERNTSVTEYAYADGGLSDKTFNKNGASEKPEDFGTVTAEYTQETAEPLLMAGMSVTDRIKASAGVQSTRVSYRQGSIGAAPGDNGIMNTLILRLNAEEIDTIKDADSVGRMFGLGMAEVKEVIRTGKRDPSVWLWSMQLENSGAAVSSDFPYTKVSAALARKTVFSWRNALTASTRMTGGTSLPPSQMPATNQQDGLRGYYAREFKGDRVINSYISYAQPIHMTMTGYFSVESFFDWGVCMTDAVHHDRTGAGLTVSYRFWRFPLPIGVGYTYSFDDLNWQAVFSIGGRF